MQAFSTRTLCEHVQTIIGPDEPSALPDPQMEAAVRSTIFLISPPRLPVFTLDSAAYLRLHTFADSNILTDLKIYATCRYKISWFYIDA